MNWFKCKPLSNSMNTYKIQKILTFNQDFDKFI